MRLLLNMGLQVLLAAAATSGAAQTGSTFTFKKIGTPQKGAGKLINIHVEPTQPVERKLSNIPEVPPAPGITKLPTISGSDPDMAAWFWSRISPDLSAARPGRLSEAVEVVADRPAEVGAFGPSTSTLSGIETAYGAESLRGTAGSTVSPAMVLAVMAVESAGQPAARSSAGAVGLMQLMPATATRFGVADRTDPAQSISGGVKYLDFLLEEFGGDPLLALAGYNAGEGAVARSGGVPAYAETRAYVPKVVAAWTAARTLCLQPPVRITDGCLFRGLAVAAQ